MTQTLGDDSDGEEAAAPRRAGKRARSDAPAPAPPRAAPKQAKTNARTGAAIKSRKGRAAARKELAADIELLRTQQGESRDYNVNRLILTIALQLRRDALDRGEELSNSSIADEVARLSHVGARGHTVSVLELIKEWDSSKSVIVLSSGSRGHKPRHLTEEQVAEIEHFIEKAHSKGACVTNATIRAHHMKKDRKVGGVEIEGIVLTRRVVQYALHHFLGYRHGKIRGKAVKRDAKRPDLIRQYLLDYSNALELERNGTHVVVYVDESYVHQNAGNQFSYFKATDNGKRVEKTSGRGTIFPRRFQTLLFRAPA